jgi:hypothetical protein
VEPLTSISLKDLLLLALGSAVTLFGKYVPQYIASYRKVTPLLGTWYCYHWSRIHGQASFRHSVYKFQRSLWGLRLEISRPQGGAVVYRGDVSFEGHDFIVDAEALTDRERILLFFGSPVVHDRDKTTMAGFSLGIDFDREKYASVKVCSTSALPDDEAKEMLRQATILVPDECALRLNRLRASRPTPA